MSTVPSFPEGQIEALARLLGECGSGTDITRVLNDRGLVDDRPILAFNTLQTDTERSEHKGFAALLKGCFSAVRNPLAHQPKLLWQGEDDAADYLSLISLLHRKLDDCVLTRM